MSISSERNIARSISNSKTTGSAKGDKCTAQVLLQFTSTSESTSTLASARLDPRAKAWEILVEPLTRRPMEVKHMFVRRGSCYCHRWVFPWLLYSTE